MNHILEHTLLALTLLTAALTSKAEKREEITTKDGLKYTLIRSDDNKYQGAAIDGKIIVPVRYTKLDASLSGFAASVREKSGYSIVTRTDYYTPEGLCITEDWPNVESVRPLLDYSQKSKPSGYFKFTLKGKTGILDSKGTCISAPQWKDVSCTSGVLVVEDFSRLKGVINPLTSEIIMKPAYDRIFLHRGYFKVELNGYGGAVDIANKQLSELTAKDLHVVIKPDRYASVTRYKGHYSAYSGTGSKGFCTILDTDGKVLVKGGRYTQIYPLANDCYEAKIGNRAGILNEKGEQLFFTEYNALSYDTKQNCYISYLGNAKGKVALDGTVIEAPKPTVTRRTAKTTPPMVDVTDTKGNKGMETPDGKVLVPCSYDLVVNYSSGYLGLHRDGFSGAADLSGNILIPIERKYHFTVRHNYRKIPYFSVYKGALRGLCDSTGRELVAPDRWHYVSPFDVSSDGSFSRFKVRSDKGRGIIDAKGNIVVPPVYTELYESAVMPGMIIVYDGEFQGLVNSDGEEIIPPKYNKVYTLSQNIDKQNSYYEVNNGDFCGVYNSAGDCLLPANKFTYVSIQPNFETDIAEKNVIKATVGDVVAFYSLNGKLLKQTESPAKRREYLDKAHNAFGSKKWSDASKYYKKAHEISADYSSAFNIGASYYNSGDYGKALKWFRKSIAFPHSDESHNNLCGLIDECESIQAQRREQRASLIAGLFMTAVNTGLNIYQMNQEQKTRRKSMKSGNWNNYQPGRYSGSSSSEDSESDGAETNLTSKPKSASSCGACGGKGSTIEYVANYGIDKRPYCDECGKTVTSGHYHRTCTRCGGTGKL